METPPLCEGEYTDIRIQSQGNINSDGYDFVWYAYNNEGWNALVNQDTPNLQVSPAQTTDYLVFVVDKATGCARSKEFTVKVTELGDGISTTQIYPLEQYVRHFGLKSKKELKTGKQRRTLRFLPQIEK